MLERLGKPIAHVVFDKTGTLTETGNQIAVSEWTWLTKDHSQRTTIAALVAAAEDTSSHPFAIAIAAAARQQQHEPTESNSHVHDDAVWAKRIGPVTHVPGQGIEAADHGLRIGQPGFALGDHQSDNEGPFAQADDDTGAISITINGSIVATLSIGEQLKPGAPELIHALSQRGYVCHIASGDGNEAVSAAAERCGIAPERAHARCGPEDKARLVQRLQADGQCIVVGDGINDAAALAQADIAIGVRGGLESALDVCDIFIVQPDLDRLERVLRAGPMTNGTIRANIAVSCAYNVIGMGLAAAGLWGHMCAPWRCRCPASA